MSITARTDSMNITTLDSPNGRKLLMHHPTHGWQRWDYADSRWSSHHRATKEELEIAARSRPNWPS